MKTWLIPFVIVLAHATAFADSCTDIDVRDRLSPQAREALMTPYDQGGIGWCYSYSMADLLTARFGRSVAPMHIALSYSSSVSGLGAIGRDLFGNKIGGFYEGGTMHDTFNLVRKQGYTCEEGSIVSNQKSQRVAEMYLQSVTDLYNSKTSAKLEDKYDAVLAESYLKDHFPQIDTSAAMNYIKSRKAGSPAKALMAIANKACQGHEIGIPGNLKMVSIGKDENTKMTSEIDRILKSGRPIFLSYTVTRMIDPALRENFFAEALVQHASTIIGRRKSGSQCVYVIRNSWGKDCSSYASGINCNEEEGTYEMPASEMERSAIRIGYIAN